VVSATDADEEDTANSGKKILNDLIHHTFILILTDTDICVQSFVHSIVSFSFFSSVVRFGSVVSSELLVLYFCNYLLNSSFVIEKIFS
jgi:hypothetical protein